MGWVGGGISTDTLCIIALIAIAASAVGPFQKSKVREV